MLFNNSLIQYCEIVLNIFVSLVIHEQHNVHLVKAFMCCHIILLLFRFLYVFS